MVANVSNATPAGTFHSDDRLSLSPVRYHALRPRSFHRSFFHAFSAGL